ncbi:Ig-like domain-containing protein [Vagococcus entomophilus]|uniref:Bacterial Ig domain-containing protein n=1 Tax=Vagococcus entomophilus TaxID=1160095 RepID=A0A430AH35_9ENTE|nr:Ig-like domain-containing protein [Vagococcus entomophilus]RSU07221.1 hypothetical protein CBF30_08180 [Vagococcus entomophilus]
MNKKKIIITSLVLGLGIYGHSMQSFAAEHISDSPLMIQSKQQTRALAPADYDPSIGWEVENYTSNMGIDVSNIFLQAGQRPNTGIHYATVNFGNIGNSTFTAKRVFKLKAGKTYKMKFLYGTRTHMKGASGYVDFNGKKYIATSNPVIDGVHEETIVVQKDRDYVIRMQFDSPKRSGVFLMVGYDANDSNGGMDVSNTEPKPVVEVPEADTHNIKGTGQSGHTVKVFDSVNNQIGSTVVDSFGNFAIQTTRPLLWKEKLTLVQYDVVNNYASDAVTKVVEDTIAPVISVENIEYNRQVLTGKTEPNTKVIIEKDGKKIQELTSNRNGDFTQTMKDLKFKDKVTVYALDRANNKSEVKIAQVIDTIAPELPSLNKIMNTDKVLTGKTTEPNLKITVSIGSQTFTGVSDAEGNFTINLARTYVVGTKIFAYASDEAGNKSPTANISVASNEPTKAPVVNKVGDSDLHITGTAEARAKVMITLGADKYSVITGADGKYVMNLNNKYKAGTKGVASAVGLSGIASVEVNFTVVDNTAPEAPVIHDVTTKDTSISGEAEAGATVKIIVEDISTGSYHGYSGVADSNGNYQIEMGRTYLLNSQIEAVATDAAGNESQTANAKVVNSPLTIGLAEDEKITSQDNILNLEASRENCEVTVTFVTGASNTDVYKGKTDGEGKVVFEFPGSNGIIKTYPAGTKFMYTIEDKTTGEKATGESVVMPRTPTLADGGYFLVSGMNEIAGYADSKATVYLKIQNQDGKDSVEMSVNADENGKFVFQLPRPTKVGDVVTVYQSINGVESDSQDFSLIILTNGKW